MIVQEDAFSLDVLGWEIT